MQKNLSNHEATLRSPSVDYYSLQLAVDGEEWRNNVEFRMWIFEEILKLLESGHPAPEGFGTADFWELFFSTHFSDLEQPRDNSDSEEENSQTSGDSINDFIDEAYDQHQDDMKEHNDP